MKWLRAHYQACRAVARVKWMERRFDHFRSVVFCRLENHNIWLDSTVKHLEANVSSVNHALENIDLMDAGQRQLGRDVVDISEQVALLNARINNLNNCIQIQNNVIREIAGKLEDVSQVVIARPSFAGAPSKN